MLFFVSTISSVVYLRCRMQIQAKPMNRKRFWSCLLSNGGRKLVQKRAEPSLLEICRVQPSFCKLLQTVYRLTFSYSKRGLATFASDKRDIGLTVVNYIKVITSYFLDKLFMLSSAIIHAATLVLRAE